VPAPTGGGSGVGGSTSSGSGGSPASTNHDGADQKSHKEPSKKPSKKPHKPAGPTLDPLGEQPAAASVFTSDGPSTASGADATIDGDAKTAWSTKKSDRGIMVTPHGGTWGAIGVISDESDWSLDVYYTDESEPGSLDSGDWKQKVSTNAEKRNKFSVPDARHYLVLVVAPAGTAGINEIQLYQK
jgi:hypothetical protein